MSCKNLGDEKLERALCEPTPELRNVVTGAFARGVRAVASRRAAGADHERRVEELTTTIVGDVGERAMAKILTKLGHDILIASDKHALRPSHRLPNDVVSVDRRGRLLVHDVKATVSGKVRVRPNAEGTHDLPTPRLSKTKDGSRQLSDPYNLVRIEETITFGTPVEAGSGPQSLVTRIDLKSMQYQTWEVDADGRTTKPVGPPQSAELEIAEALAEVLRENGL